MSHDDHEALFDSGSDIHCMFGGHPIFSTRRKKESLQLGTGLDGRLSPESQWLGQDPPADPALSRRG